MITFVLAYRNREISIVKNCLDSLMCQSNIDFKVVLVDYGSEVVYKDKICKLIENYPFISQIRCETEQQLWCKSRAINIALKQCETSHFFVGDVDMIYHPNLIETLHRLKEKNEIVYFQVGFLSKTESKTDKNFNDYTINFKSTHEATGMTLFKTEDLKSINGYDEYYNGWGSEDTDVHVRFRKAEKSIVFYDSSVLMLHQWHPKKYRNTTSIAPFHSKLERINQKYLEYSKQTEKVVANTTFDWGKYSQKDYLILDTIDLFFNITNELADIKGFLNSTLFNITNKVVSVIIVPHNDFKSLNLIAKKVLGKKVNLFLDMQDVNDLVLETIVMNFRNQPYKFAFNRVKQEISLIIKL